MLAADLATAPTVGGFLYVTLASVGAGMTVSAVRWLILDTIHHHTGIRRPDWDFSRLQSKLAAFYALANNHYRYYQFHGNSLVALVVSALLFAFRSSSGVRPTLITLSVAAALVLLFFAASRDALGKYYSRTDVLLSDHRE